MKNRLLLIVAAVILVSVYSMAQTEENLLLKAYKDKSEIILDEFFMNWQKDIPPFTHEQLAPLSDTIKEVYNIYSDFLQEYSVKGYIADSKYMLLGENIWYEIDSTHDFNLTEREKEQRSYKNIGRVSAGMIKTFRPDIKVGGRQGVFFTDKYYKLYKDFLIPDTSVHYATDSFEKKKEFIKGYSPILLKGNYESPDYIWSELHADPVVSSVVFNYDFMNAKIYFTDGCAHMLAHLKKTNGKWEIIDINTLITC